MSSFDHTEDVHSPPGSSTLDPGQRSNQAPVYPQPEIGKFCHGALRLSAISSGGGNFYLADRVALDAELCVWMS